MHRTRSHSQPPRAASDKIRGIVGAMRDETGNMPPLPGIFPDYQAPIVRTGADGQRELVKARWGMPSPKNVLEQAAEVRANKLRAKGKEVDFNSSCVWSLTGA